MTAGRPFVGPSGQLLDKTLRIAGLDRADGMAMNAVACRPPQGLGETQWTKALACCAPYREAALARTRGPVLALGGYALRATTGHTGIQSWYGYPIQGTGLLAGRPVFPALHQPSS